MFKNPFALYAMAPMMISAQTQTNPKSRARSSKGKFAKEHSLHGSLNKAIMITDKSGRQKLEKVKIALQKGYISAEK